jgi:hypothetical protein
MALQNEFTFDAVGYLQQNPDIAQAAPWLADNKYEAYRHYQEYGKNEGRPANFFDPKTPTTPDRWIPVNFSTDPENPVTVFQDPATKEVYSSQTPDSIIPGGKNTVLSQQAKELSENIFTNWSQNRNGQNYFLSKDLEAIKQYAPEAYYPAEFNLLSKQSGWQHGQNTFDRAKPYQERIESLVPDALKAGLTPDQINSLVGGGFSAASAQNQQRIVNEQQSGGSGFNLGELVRGVAPIAAFAIGAPFLDAALAGGAAAGSAASGAGAGGSIGGINLGGAFLPTAGSGASFTVPGLLGTSGLSVAPEVTSAFTAPYTASPFGTLTPPLSGSGAIPGAMSTAIPGTGLTGALPAGVLAGDGTLGTTLGATYMAAGPGQFAVNALGNAIPASSVGIGGFAPASGLSIGINDALNAARIGKGLIGGTAQPTPQGAAPRPQNIMPRGQVDYSGILNLLQVPSPQRNMYSLLG